jgi:biotin synthase
VNVAFVPGVKAGDWLLYATNTAVRKISKRDAREIIELLESYHPKADPAKLSKKYKDIITRSKHHDLTKKEIMYLLSTKDVEEEALFAEADVLRKTYIKDFICVHGIIEFSNWCKNDCVYCGIRSANRHLKRYRMLPDEIVRTAVDAVKKRGYKLLVLQSGDDDWYADEMLVDIISRIKEKAHVFIFMSVGERSKQSYLKLKKAGASGVLLRFESSNSRLFKYLHPRGKKLSNRLALLRSMRAMGYFIATGSLVGLPGQKTSDLADDILLMKRYANMATLGPFIPAPHTPFAAQKKGSIEMTLKMIAVLRLITKTARIPVVTALETIGGETIRKRALMAGANSLMFNVTPRRYHKLYSIYPGKRYEEKNIWEKYGLYKSEESYQMLEERMVKEIQRTKKN